MGRDYFVYLIPFFLSSVCFGEKSLASPQNAVTSVLNHRQNADENIRKYPIESSLQNFFNAWPSYQHYTLSSAVERFGGVSVQKSRKDMLMTSVDPSSSFSVREMHFASKTESEQAFNAYIKESDPVRGHGLAWELVVPKDEKIFWLTTNRNFSERAKLQDSFLKAVQAPHEPKFICVDTYGCKIH